jgi:hypothetical protein
LAGHIADAKNTNWCTPKLILDPVRRVFGGTIHLDPCSNAQATVGALVNYTLPEHDGLVENWNYPTIFVNMPFGRSYMHAECKTICIVRHTNVKKKKVAEYVCPRCERVLSRPQVKGSSIADWVARCSHAYKDSGGDASVIALMPAAVSTRHMQHFVFATAQAMCYLNSRLHFDGLPGESIQHNTAPMDCCLPYWGPDPEAFEREFQLLGHVDRYDVQRRGQAA